MQDEDKSREQLIAELHEFRQRLSDSEKEKAERKGVEEALRKTEQQLKLILDTVPALIWQKDQEGKYLQANKAYCDTVGLSSEAILGKTDYDLFPAEMADQYVSADRKVLNSGIPDLGIEEQHQKISGERGWSRTDKMVHYDIDGQIAGTIGFALDITERKRSERECRESEERYRSLFDHSMDVILLTKPDGSILDANPAACEMFGRSLEEIRSVGRNGLVDMTDPRLQAALDERARRGVRMAEITMLRANGDKFPVEITSAVFVDANGQQKTSMIIRDITDRKRAEEALRDRDIQFQKLYSHVPGMIYQFMKRPDGTYCVPFTTEAIKDIFGCSPEDVREDFSPITRVILSEDLDRLIDSIESSAEGMTAWQCAYRVQIPGRPIRWMLGHSTPEKLLDGSIIWHGFNTDITDRKRAEEALKESQQQLADIINFLPDATLVIDREGKVIAWNRAIEEMTGVRALDMLGKGNYEYSLPFYGERRPILIDLVLKPQEEIETSYTIIERIKTGLVGEAYVPALRGSEAHLLGTASILRDSQGHVVGAIESIRDITERRRVEDALARAEAKYRGIFENALEGIYQTTVVGRFISCNPTFACILGYDSPEEILHTITDIAQQLYVNPEQRAELLRLLDERGTAKKFEVQFFRKDKSVAWLVLNVRGVRDERGQLTYLEGIAQDVTESRALESQLRQAQKIEAVGTLAGGIAHDFNNILGIIMGYAEIAELDLSSDSKVKRSINEVLKATRRARDLVRQILTFSRKTEQERKPLQITPIVKEATKLLRASLPTTIEIRQQIDLWGGNDLVFADPTQIHQVLMNLATNAAHAMRENGGVLRVNLSSVHFDSPDLGKPMELSQGEYIKLTVEDTGHGMDRRIIDRIFDPYFTTKGPGEGTGLGLAVVHGIVKNHGGAITVNSELGKGTAFHVYLPRLEGDETLEKEGFTSMPRGNETILLVDDEEALVNAVKQMLEHLGYKVTATTNSAEALHLFVQRPEQFDLIVTDYTMPKMTGTDLAREIMQIRSNIPIILCTGFNERISEKSAIEMGISALIMKPVSLRNIGEKVRKVLDRQ
jgi:PAS domain S-box-containing protein